jgi:tight adherence protein B
LTDSLAAGLAALTAWIALALPGRIRRRQEAVNSVDRLGSASLRGVEPPEQRVLLEGLALRVARTRPGAWLRSYCASTHPGIPFSDFLAIGMAGAIGGALAGALLTGGGIMTLALALGTPFALERGFLRLHGRRSARMEQQLPEALALQAGTLRAGHSLVRSLRVLGAEAKPPLAEEIARTLAEIDLGRPIEDALRRLSERSASRDIDLWVTAMLVHRHTGGNLANIADSLAERVTQRLQLRGEIRALTAQGRLSGLVVALAPVVFLLLLSVGSREQMQMLYSTPIGWVILTSGLVMNGLGLMWIRWILRIRP